MQHIPRVVSKVAMYKTQRLITTVDIDNEETHVREVHMVKINKMEKYVGNEWYD